MGKGRTLRRQKRQKRGTPRRQMAFKICEKVELHKAVGFYYTFNYQYVSSAKHWELHSTALYNTNNLQK